MLYINVNIVKTTLEYSQLQIGLSAQNLEIISKNFQFSTRRARILMRFISCDLSHAIYHVLLGTNRKSHGQNSGSLKSFKHEPFCWISNMEQKGTSTPQSTQTSMKHTHMINIYLVLFKIVFTL